MMAWPTIVSGALLVAIGLTGYLGADLAAGASAPRIASSSVRASVSAAWADFHWFMPRSRPR